MDSVFGRDTPPGMRKQLVEVDVVGGDDCLGGVTWLFSMALLAPVFYSLHEANTAVGTSFLQRVMEMEQGGRLDDKSRPDQPSWI